MEQDVQNQTAEQSAGFNAGPEGLVVATIAPAGQSTEPDPVADAPIADAPIADAPVAKPKAFSIARIDAIVLKLWQKVNDKDHALIADIEKMLGL